MHAPWFLNSASAAPQLRIGILLDRPTLPAYLAEALEHVANSNFARLELAIFNPQAARPPNVSSAGHGLFTRYVARDAKRISETPDPLAEVDCSHCFKHVASLSVTPIADLDSQRFPDDDVAHIREKNLDVLIKLGFENLRGDILNAARYGVWAYHHGDPDRYRGGPPYFWEVYENNLLTCTALERLADDPNDNQILYKGVFATLQGSSWARNRVQPYWGSTTFLIQKLRQLHECGWESVEAEILKPSSTRLGKTYSLPTDLEMLPWLSRVFLRTGANRVRHSIVGEELPHWMLGVKTKETLKPCLEGDGLQAVRRMHPSGAALAAEELRPRLASNFAHTHTPLNLRDFRWIRSPRGHFYADPFVIEHESKPWVFFEDLPYSTDKGIIVCAEINPDGNLSPAIPVLELPYHLSYPCIFRESGELYMVPESVADGTVQLYRCERFPDGWKQVKVLLRAPAVDTTVWIEGGLYWFFVTLQEPRGGGLQLWLFYSRSLAGELIHHPRSPISTDIRYSRGAGAIFREDGKLIRPSQDCSGSYGRLIVFNEITKLNEHEYAERPGAVIDTHSVPNMIGTHSYGRVGDVVVIDGCMPLPAKQVR